MGSLPYRAMFSSEAPVRGALDLGVVRQASDASVHRIDAILREGSVEEIETKASAEIWKKYLGTPLQKIQWFKVYDQNYCFLDWTQKRLKCLKIMF